MTDQTTNAPARVWPADIANVYTLTRTMRHDMTDSAAEEFKEWRQACAQDTRAWMNDPAAPVPDWNAYREWANQISDDDGSPRLFVIVDPIAQARAEAAAEMYREGWKRDPSQSTHVYGSFSRPMSHVWARAADLDSAEFIQSIHGRSDTAPYTYIVTDSPLSAETIRAYELTPVLPMPTR